MTDKNLFHKNSRFYCGLILTVLEGLLSGSNYIVIYMVLKMLYERVTDIKNIFSISCLVGIIFVIRLVIYSIGYTQSQVGGAEISKNIRLGLGDKLRKVPLSCFTQKREGQYINIMTADVNSYEQILTHKLAALVKNGVLSVIVLAFVSVLYFPAAVILMISLFLLIPEMWLSFRIVRKYGMEKNLVTAKAVGQIVEYIDGIQTFRSYGMGGTKNRNTTETLRKFSTVSYQYEAHGIPVNFAFNIINWLTVPLAMWIGYIPWQSGSISAITFLFLCMLPMVLAKLTASISVDMFSYRNLLISKANIKNVLAENEESKSTEVFSPKEHGISFRNVSFSYVQEEPVLKNISFSIPDHGLTAIVGDSGSGKSTILNLIAKYYDPDSGEIGIGGQSIRNANAEDVLTLISMVDQDTFLFNDTVRENIRYAKPSSTDEEIENACKKANCDQFIHKLEEGYDTSIGENGNLLSGGERQRLSIARAILKDSPILLLDEATSSLDIENEFAVKQAISNLLQENKTVVMIAHTLSITKNADQILVVADGKVVESGTHEKLLVLGGKYTAMWNAEIHTFY